MKTSPDSSVANEEFAPLCGAAATSVAALKTPVASEGGEGLPGTSKGFFLCDNYLSGLHLAFLGVCL